ncbi:hypothetical protein [Sphingobacterium griseoflavum]|uniref:DUF4836 domain-containing protein n=1 Tax=Sphingobacterium griseoflavum TaxID=1474952 RepID=A0ABQ3HW96_9SPHI|nr:hypothetical protein [Sphingobacterium griseoflavum]GHE32830.1 hypothetical protein GCM10017764_14770 [Sphingobacterium griseoflavum]
MMSPKKCLIALFALSTAALAHGQDLLHRVPTQADLVAVVNSQAIVRHSSLEKLNAVLTQLGAFDALQTQHALDIHKFEDFDLAYDRHTYIYKTDTDSSYYLGILIPLKAGHQIEQHIFADLSPEHVAGGFRKAIAKDGKTQLAWNDNSLFLLTGDYKSSFFQHDSIAAAYGLDLPKPTNDWYDMPYAVDSTAAVDNIDIATAWDEAADSAYAVVEGMNDEAIDFDAELYDSIAPLLSDVAGVNVDTLSTNIEGYDLDFDGYSDESYRAEMARNNKNDSIRNQAFSTWIARDFDAFLKPTTEVTRNKKILRFDKQNTLLHIWVKDLNDVYRSALPYEVLTMSLGFDMKNLDYGYQDAVLDFIQDKNVLKLKASVGLDKDVQKIFRKMYKNKVNRKFAKYIPENHLGYLSLNVNTEAYLNSLPALFARWYGPIMPTYSDLVRIGTTAMQIALDEKAIAKVMKGDHVIFINDLKKVTSTYIDYEYDEDYNYREVSKTKEEEIPNFLWMFTSEDQRIFKQLLAFAEKENKASQIDGVFKIAENEKSMPIYVFFKDNLVFVGNDQAQVMAIKENRFSASKDASIKRQIFDHTMVATVHTEKIPAVIQKMGVPIIGSWQKNVNDLSHFGDISIRVNGLKKNRIGGEFAVAFPKENTNALQYLLQQILENVDHK